MFVAFFLDWLFLILACVCLIPSFYYVDRKSYRTSSFFMFVSIGCAGWFFWPEIGQLVAQIGTVRAGLNLTLGFIAAAVVTSFVYWIFYVFKAKERFELKMQRETVPVWATATKNEALINAVRKYRIVADPMDIHYIFDDPSNDLRITVPSVNLDGLDLNDEEVVNLKIDELNTAVAAVLPPRFAVCKQFIVGAGIAWPITIIWLLISRVVKQLIERIVSTFGGTFNRLSTLAFGKF